MSSSNLSFKNILIIIVCVVIAYHYVITYREVTQKPGVLVTEDPIQQNISTPKNIQYKDYTITPLADFTISARVLSKTDYQFDHESELSPTDLALGWGPMSDSRVLEKITISQSGRWYRWHVDEFPIPQRDIEIHSANMHMIPADASVSNTLKNIHTGNVIYLRGKLVRINKADGWYWQSSLTREDTGDGACEVIWVENITIKL